MNRQGTHQNKIKTKCQHWTLELSYRDFEITKNNILEILLTKYIPGTIIEEDEGRW